MKIQSRQEKSTTMRSRSGSVGTAIIIIALTIWCLLPLQMVMLKALTEQMNIGKVKDIIETASMRSVSFIDPEILGRSKTVLNIQKAKKDILDQIKEMTDGFNGFSYKGSPDVEISLVGNNINIIGEICVYSFTGKVRKIRCENSFVIELPEEEA